MQKDRTIDWYIDRALERQGFKSDLQLAKAMGFKGSGVSNWRLKKAWPSEEKICELATLAGIDAQVAVIDLALWKSTGKAREAYANILEKITAAILVLGCFFLFSVGPAYAGTCEHYEKTNYTLSHLLARLRAYVLRRIKGFFKPASAGCAFA